MGVEVGLDNSAVFLLMSYNANQDKIDRVSRAVATGYDVNQASDNPLAFMQAQELQAKARGCAVISSKIAANKSQLDRLVGTLKSIRDTVKTLSDLVTALPNTPSIDAQKSAAMTVTAYLKSIKSLIDGSGDPNGLSLGSGAMVINLSPDAAFDPSGASSTSLLTLLSPSLSIVGSSGILSRKLSNLPVGANDPSLVKISDAATATVYGVYLSNQNGQNQLLYNLNKWLGSVASAESSIGAFSNSLDIQLSQVRTNQNSYNAQADALTKTDLTADSAMLTALQTRQQLLTNMLSASNQRMSSIISLFR